MTRNLLIILLLFISICTNGQSVLSGKITDKSDKKPLVNASIVLLNQDSVLQHFGRADENGRFEIKKIIPGQYLMLVTYPKFELISKNITLEGKDLKLEDIEVNSQMNLLEEIVVTQRIPIRIKGDTIEYDARSFETEKNAKLEDLFRRLPGLTVSGDGEITAQGKTVSKVLIDGEEFFGYDPKIAIRNVRADAVDKVQVYERRSEESEFTGIDDGQRFQTVNVILKEEAREGIFGNAEAAYGTEDLYMANLFAAKFNRTERIGLTANINNMGASSGGREGSLRTNSQIRGNPHAESIGTSYENQLLNKRLHVNGNYNFGNNGNENETSTYSRTISNQNEIQESNSESSNSNSNQNNGIRTQFRFKIDSTQNLNVNFNAGITRGESERESNSKIKTNEQNSRDNFTSNQSNTNSNSNDIRLNYRKRLNRTGRSLNLHLNNRYSSDESNENVYTRDDDYRRDTTIIVDQNRIGKGLSNNFETQLSFNDRLSQKANYSIGYSFRKSYSESITDAFDLDGDDNIIGRDSTYSKNQIDNNNNQAIDLNFNFNNENWILNITNTTSLKDQRLKDLYREIDRSRTFWDNNVNINFNYNITRSRSLGLIYQNNFNIPSFEQLQPIQPRVNEYYEVIGNPNLKRSINNSLKINYNTFSLLKSRSINVNGDLRLTSNPIVTITDISDTKTTVMYENLAGKSNLTVALNANRSQPLRNKSIQFNQGTNVSYSDEFNYINESPSSEQQSFILNNSKTTSAHINFGLNEQNSSGFDFDINTRIGLNAEKNSARSDLDAVNLSAGSTGYIKYFLPKKFFITTNAVYSYTGPTKIFTQSIHQFYTNLELSKAVLKSESLIISLKAFDVFNTFNNINRSSSNTNFSETQQLVLTRYILVGLKWDFNKNLGKKKND